MRSSFIATAAAPLARTPNSRQMVARRRIAVLCAVVGLALASAAVSFLAAPRGVAESAAPTGPFSYFPSE